MGVEIPGWVFGAIREYSGLDASLLSSGGLIQALGRRIAAVGLSSPAAYWPLLRGEGTELDSLVQALTNKETYFFREPHQFQALRDRVLSELLAGQQQGEGAALRFWSAGCSTGEEAYSLAMTLLDYQHTTGARFDATIIGTDIDAAALAHARQGCYDERAVRFVSDDLRGRYLARQGDRWCVVPDVARLVTFRTHNLAAPCSAPDLAGVDVIFCRNVTIYFDEAMRERLNACLADLLRDGGYLFVASAETLGHDQGRLALVSLGNGFAFQKRRATKQRSESRAAGPGTSRQPQAADVHGAAAAPDNVPVPAASRAQGWRMAAPLRAAGSPTARNTWPASPAPSPPRHQEHPAFEAARRAFQEQAYDAALHQLALLSPQDAAQPEATCLRAAVLLQQAHPEEANQICRRVLDGDPWHADAYLLLALGYRQQGLGAEAVGTLKQAIYLRPDDPQAHFFLGDTYRVLGLANEARREYENTLNILERKGPERGAAREAGRAGPARIGLAGVSDDLMRRACHAHLSNAGRRTARAR